MIEEPSAGRLVYYTTVNHLIYGLCLHIKRVILSLSNHLKRVKSLKSVIKTKRQHYCSCTHFLSNTICFGEINWFYLLLITLQINGTTNG